MATVAQLDKAGVLLGFKKVSKKDWVTRDDQVAVEDGCDLAPGRYRWDRDGDTFVPLPPAGSQDALEQEPNAIRAVALGLMTISRTIELPDETLDWLEFYAESVEGRGITFKRSAP